MSTPPCRPAMELPPSFGKSEYARQWRDRMEREGRSVLVVDLDEPAKPVSPSK